MPINILMPALSPTMTEGTLAKWHKQPGDEVVAGDVVAEIETDKATMEVEAVDEGTLGKILIEEGTEGVAVNTPIAILLEEGEDESDLEKAESAPKPEPEKVEAKAEAPKETAEPEEKTDQRPAAPQKAEAPAPVAPKDAEGGRIFASPLARRMAQQAGLDLAQIKGSGPNGRIVKADIEAAVKGGAKAAPQQAAPEAAPKAAVAPAPAGPSAKEFADQVGLAYEEVSLSSMRKVIAKRMVESKTQVPHFYLSVDMEIDALLKARKELNERLAAAEEGVKISVNDFIVRASALALRKVPAANAAYNGASMLQFKTADISVAVATEGGLITPIVKQAETKGLSQIAREMKDLAARAREGKLKPEEYQGGTFSISNLGMYGVKHFDAVINPPQGCILAVGAGEQRAVVRDGALAIATVMTCTLSVDHRVVDGAVGAQFLAALKRLIEDPMSMLL